MPVRCLPVQHCCTDPAYLLTYFMLYHFFLTRCAKVRSGPPWLAGPWWSARGPLKRTAPDDTAAPAIEKVNDSFIFAMDRGSYTHPPRAFIGNRGWPRTVPAPACCTLVAVRRVLVVGIMGCASSKPKDVEAQKVKVESTTDSKGATGGDVQTIVGIPLDELKEAYFLDWSCKTLTEADAKAIAKLASTGGLKNLKQLCLSRWQLDKTVLGEDGLKALAAVVADRTLPVDQLWLADM